MQDNGYGAYEYDRQDESHLPLNPVTDRYETGGDEIELADEGELGGEGDDGWPQL